MSVSPKLISLARSALALLLVCLLVAGVAAVYVSQETPLYFWDYSNYHSQLISLVHKVRQSGVGLALNSVARSVSQSDYNPLPVLPLLPLALFLEPTRMVYIVGLLVLLLPLVAWLSSDLSQLCWLPQRKPRSLSWFLLIPLLSPLLWASPLRGYPDLIAVVPLAFVSIQGVRSRHFLRLPARQSLFCGFLLWLVFALRRHFAYAVITFYLLHAFLAFLRVLRFRGWRKWLSRYALILCGSLLPLVAFQPGLLFRILTTSYSDIYAAYDLGPLGNLHALYALTGPIWPLIWFVGVILACRFDRPWIVFHAGLAFASYFFFQFTQKTGPHHVLPLVLWLIPAASWPIWLAARPSITPLFKRTILLSALSVFLAPSLASFWPGFCGSNTRSGLSWFCPGRRFLPLRHPAYQDLRRFAKQLQAVVPPGSRIAVSASSTLFNAEILALLLSDGLTGLFRSPYEVQTLGDIDRRDGFNLSLFQSVDYLVISTEPMLHRPREFQRVVTIPVEIFGTRAQPFSQTWLEVDLGVHPDPTSPAAKLRLFQRVSSPPPDLLASEVSALIQAFSASGSQAVMSGGRILLP